MIPGDTDGPSPNSGAALWDVLEEFGDKVDAASGLDDAQSYDAAMDAMLETLVEATKRCDFTPDTIVELIQPSIQTDQVLDGLIKAFLVHTERTSSADTMRWIGCLESLLSAVVADGSTYPVARPLVHILTMIEDDLTADSEGPWLQVFGRLVWIELERGNWTVIGLLPVALGLSPLPVNIAPPPRPLLPLVKVCCASIHPDPEGALHVLESLSRGILPAYLRSLEPGRRREIEERVLLPMVTSEELPYHRGADG